MKFKLRLAMLCVILTLCMSAITVNSFAAEDNTYRSEKYDVTDNSFSVYGYLEEKESATYSFTLDSKSNVVIFSRYNRECPIVDGRPYSSSVGIFRIKIRNSKGEVVYTNPVYEDHMKKYGAMDVDAEFQLNTTLPKGTYKMTITESNPWNWSKKDLQYVVTVKWAEPTEVMEELVVPKAVTLKASTDPATGYVNLSWDKAEGADGYIVLRARKTKYGKSTDCLSRWVEYGEGYMIPHDEFQETFFVDKKTSKGNIYEYSVVAVNSKNYNCSDRLGGAWSNSITVTFKLPSPEVTVSNVLKTGKPRLSWEKVKNADSYSVYRATSKNGNYKKIATISESSFTDTTAKTGKTYYYKVKAVKKIDNTANSVFSTKVKGLCKLARPTVKISNVAKTGKIRLTWKAIDGADKYIVYRSTSKNGTYKRLYITSKTSFTNTGAKAEQLYYYKVKAIDADKESASSAYSVVFSKRCDLNRPVVKISKSTKAKLTWTKVVSAKEYKIYRATSKNGKYKEIETVTATKYTDKTAKKNKIYYYKVKAISGKSSAANSAYSLVVKKEAK